MIQYVLSSSQWHNWLVGHLIFCILHFIILIHESICEKSCHFCIYFGNKLRYKERIRKYNSDS